MLRKKKFLIGGAIVLFAISYLGFIAFQSSATYYFTVSELLARGNAVHGDNVRVNGQVVPESFKEEGQGLTVKFTITSEKENLRVIYEGVVPDTFKAGGDVVVEGHINTEGIFLANTLMPKCPSRYVPK